MMKFKISGLTAFVVAMATVLVWSTRNSGFIIKTAAIIMTVVNRIMMCDIISLFMVVCFVGVFGIIVPALTFEVRVVLDLPDTEEKMHYFTKKQKGRMIFKRDFGKTSELCDDCK